jgi:hypothetical protein
MRLAMNCCRSVLSTATSSMTAVNCGGSVRPQPYGHRNDFTTLDEIILAHGGNGRQARDAYAAASADRKISPDRISQDPGDCAMKNISTAARPQRGLARDHLSHAARAQPDFTADVPTLQEEAASAGIDQSYTGRMGVLCRRGCCEFRLQRRPSSRTCFLPAEPLRQSCSSTRARPAGRWPSSRCKHGLRPEDLTGVLGAYPLDIDNDRHTDLVLLRLGRNLVLKGGPTAVSKRQTGTSRSMAGRAWSTGMSAIWEKGNRFPTIAIGNYVDRSAPGTPFGTCEPNQLLQTTPR